MKLEPGDLHDMKPVIAAIVGEVLDRMNGHNDALAGRLGFNEFEAATLCGIPKHKLRDARLRGEVAGRRVGKSVIYERSELLRWLREK